MASLVDSVADGASKLSLKKGAVAEPLPRFGRVKNTLKMGIVGLPNVGKSSLFNLLGDSANAAAENFPFCTIDPNEARCAVPDKRYKALCDRWNPPSKYPAYLQLVDIAGLIRGASEGAGLGNAFLSHIQAVDGLFHVVRAFDSADVTHVEDTVDPVRDLETITSELCKKDAAYVSAQRALREKDVKKNPTMKLPPLFFTVMDRAEALLAENKPLGRAIWNANEIEKINELIPECITTKPMIFLINMSRKAFVKGGNKYLPLIKAWIDSNGGGLALPFSVEFEEELSALRKAGDVAGAAALIAELGTGRGSVLPRVIKCGYNVLDLMYYFTAGEKEVRCWTVMKGVTAPQAAGVIHSDFEKGFIKAECVSFDDFMEHSGGEKGFAKIKAAGKYRQEGKTYVVKDGDIIHFMFNVTKSPGPKK
ncbi:P-loop containing nucleoside triphosphate hydrolase protein [Pelagophyceae sp. CCMP2097]|nr:P-loop containing nucleoside triphosphate hydrolase protein [Pelagophyceae sp. CCMP2097]